MRLLGSALFVSLVTCGVSTAWAQYGMYGSPDVLPVQQNASANSAAPAAYQAYPYPAQPQATAKYQPHQPGAQYQYPAPAAQQATWTTPAEQPAIVQPMAAPSAVPVASSQGNGMMNQMIAEQGNGCAGGCNNNANCGENVVCGQGRCSPWYASLSAIVVGRSDGRRMWTSHVAGSESEQLTNTQLGMAWKWGGEVRFGRRFCCDCVPYAIEASYWTADPFTAYQSTSILPNYVSTPLDLNSMTFAGTAAQNWFDGAQEHRLWRRDEFHNVEINLVREQLAWGCDSNWDIGWSLGVRYFRFQDYLQFGSLAQLGTGWDDLDNTAYLSDRITNNLMGVQVGFDASYRLTDSFRLFISPKFGIYNNYLDSDFTATTGSGIVATGPYGDFPAHGTRNAVSFLTQIDLGADWQFSRNWSVRAGYRVLAATGIGLADDQFPQYINDIPEIQNVAHYSSLVLHGAFFGLTYNF